MGSRPWAFAGSVVLSGVYVFKSGLSTPIRVSLIVVPDSAEEFEGLLLEFGKPGYWSAGSLANRRGGLPASGGLLGLFPRHRLGDLVVVDLS